MSNEDGPESNEGEEDDEITRERAGRLDEKEKRLASQERELEQREQELDELEDSLLERREKIVAEREQLEAKEADLDEREESIEDRETALEERERELAARAEELEEQEQTLREYVGDQLEDYQSEIASTVEQSVRSTIENHDLGGDQQSSMANILLALVGLVLVVGGVSNLFATETAVIPALFASGPANYGTVAVLIFSGMAANLAAAAGRM